MKKTIYTLISILALVVVYVAYSPDSKENTIGVVLPLTGKFASISEDIQNAIILAQEKSGNNAVKFVFEDSAGEPQKAVSAVTNLIVNKNARMILTGTGSTANIAMSKITEQYKVPLFAITSTPELMGKEDYVFTLQPSVTKEADTMTDFVEKSGYKKVAILYDGTSDSLTAGAKHFQDKVNSKGIEVPVFEAYAQDGDQNTINLKIKSKNPDLIYILGVDKAAGPIVKKLREIGFTGDIAGFSGIESSVFLSSAGKSAEGVYLSSVPFSCDSPDSKGYCDAYKARFGNRVPQQYGAFMYNLVYQTLKQESCTLPKCFISMLYPDSVTGTFGFNSYGDIDSSIVLRMKQVRDSSFVTLE